MLAEPVTAPCPRCGCRLEPVVQLADLVGWQLINRRDQAASSVLAPSHGVIAAHLDEFIARRAERLERRRAVLAAACGLLSATVAVVLILTTLCVMAAMTNVAMERKNDVGLMKAIGGATRRVLR
jgi:hypothetical protein